MLKINKTYKSCIEHRVTHGQATLSSVCTGTKVRSWFLSLLQICFASHNCRIGEGPHRENVKLKKVPQMCITVRVFRDRDVLGGLGHDFPINTHVVQLLSYDKQGCVTPWGR